MTQGKGNNGTTLLSLKAASKESGLPVHALREAITHSELPFLRTTERARKMYIPRAALNEWIRKRTQLTR